MANTYVVTELNSDRRLAQYRSSDLPAAWELLERFGPVAVYDLTDAMRPVGYIVPRIGGGAEWRDPDAPARAIFRPALGA